MDTPTVIFDDLYCTYYQRVLHFLNRMIGGPWEEAEDLTQQTFFKAWRALPTRPHPDVLPWLYCIARHLAIDTLRQRALRREQGLPLMLTGQEELHEPDRHETVVRCADVAQALRRLPEHHRRALLYTAQGYSLQEIMHRMSCSRNKARMMVYRARQALKQEVQA